MTLEQLKEDFAKVTMAQLELKAQLEARTKELGETKASFDAEIKLMREERDRLSKQHDEMLVQLQAPKTLPGNDPADEKGQKAARAAHVKFLRNSMQNDPFKDFTSEEKEFMLELNSAPAEKRSLFVSNDELGGVLVNPTVSQRFIEKLVQISRIRELASVQAISTGQSLKMNKETGLLSAVWAQERATRAETTGNTFGQVEIFTHENYAMVRPSYQLIADAMVNIEAWIERAVSKQFAKSEGDAFLTGTGVNKPRGLFVHPDVEVVDADSTADSGGFIAEDTIDLMAELETEYAQGATLLASRATMAFMRKFVDGQNRFLDLVQRDILSNTPGRFLVDGYPGREMPGMASVGTASALVMGFGDIAEAYQIVDRAMMTVIRDPYTRKTAGEVEILYARRVGGDVVNAAAFKALRAKA